MTTEAKTFEDIADCANWARRQFAKDTRINGSEFWKRNDDAPEWLEDLCHAAHGDMWPDDWRYSFIVDALDSISDGVPIDEIESDICTSDLTDWLGSRDDRFGYVDSVVAELGHSDQGVIGDLMMGQLAERQEVFQSVLDSLQAVLDAQEDDSD